MTTSTTKQAGTTAQSSRRIKRARRARARALAPEELRERRIATRHTVREATIAMIITALILLVFNSGGLRSYARDLPESQMADQIVMAADSWHQLMRSLGTTRPKALVRQLMEELRET